MVTGRHLVCLAALGACATPALRADPIALWHFDDEAGAEFVPGKFGRAFRPEAGRAGAPVVPRNSGARTPRLGAGDWTVECWLRIDAGATEEGVIFELADGTSEKSERGTRFSVLPRENAFLLTGLAAEPGGAAERAELPNPEGPPTLVAWRHATTLAIAGPRLVREAWFHVALVHRAADAELRLWIDGRLRSVATVKILKTHAMPGEGQVSLGRDGQGGRRLTGAIDELRVSERAVYEADFAVPGTLRPQDRAAGDKALP